MKVKEYITTFTAAKELDLAPRTMQKYCKLGIIKAKRFGKMYMIERETFEEWKARNIVAAS